MAKLLDHHVAAILGNLQFESGGFRAIREYGKGSGPQNQPPPAGTKGCGYGWAQWTNSRLDDFLNYCKSTGKAPNSDDANFGFFIQDLEKSNIISTLSQNGTATAKWYGTRTFDCSTIEGATGYVMAKYERPAIGVCHLPQRIAYAKQILAGMNTNVPQRGATTGTPGNGINNK